MHHSCCAFPPSRPTTNTYAIGVNQGYTDSADFIMSIAMLAFTAGYLLMRPEQAVIRPRQVDRAAMAKILDWGILAAACVPLVIITSTRKGLQRRNRNRARMCH